MKQQIINKLKDKKAIICILGLGYVGLPLILRFVEVGYKVVGIDVDVEKIKKLMSGKSYIKHISSLDIQNALGKGFFATSDFKYVNNADVLILCVPTPLNKYREPELGFVIKTTEMALPFMRKGQIFSLESTTYPGTTEEELLPRIEKKGFKVGDDVFLVYSPEREDPGNQKFNTSTIPKIVGGHTSNCLELGVTLYSNIINKVVNVSSTKTAEMTKLLENIHRSVNIGLVNEMKIVADKMDIDIYEVIRAASTKPFGFTAYYPGPGLGGHCIPIDPFYLTWKAREFNLNTKFIELAGEINTNMPHWILGKIVNSLNDKGLSVQGANILILGIAYKKNIDDYRESPAIEIMSLLFEKGADVCYSDPYIPEYNSLRSINLTKESIKSYDLIVITTNHDDFNYKMIQENANIIVDTRGVYHQKLKNVISA